VEYSNGVEHLANSLGFADSIKAMMVGGEASLGIKDFSSTMDSIVLEDLEVECLGHTLIGSISIDSSIEDLVIHGVLVEVVINL
jgi:hypothetical protein